MAIVLSIATASASYIYYNKLALHVSVDEISQKFANKANRNERRLYEAREQDPSFSKNIIIPTSNIPIDIVIPLVEKDLETAVYTIETARKLVNHKVGDIYLIAPNSQKIKEFAAEHHCYFINEDDVLPSPEIKKYGGWIIQQFLKLNADTIVKNDHFLVVDADTFFLRPVIFIKDSPPTKNDGITYLINTHWDCSHLRKKMASDLLGNKKLYYYDLTTHHMLFSKKILKQMKDHLEKIHGEKWYKVLVNYCKSPQFNRASFSEYELYMIYLTEFSNVRFQFVSNANITVYRNFLDRLDKIVPAYAQQYKTISMHHFIKF